MFKSTIFVFLEFIVELYNVTRVTALDDGTCLVYNRTSDYKHQVLRIDKEGQTVPPVHVCEDNSVIRGILHSQGVIYIIQERGRITKCLLDDLSRSVEVYLLNMGLLYNGDMVDENTIILTDGIRGEVFIYHIKNRHKDVKITGLAYPVSVSCRREKHGLRFAVCERYAGRISIYDEGFNKIKTISSKGTEDGQLLGPECAIFSPWGSILVADTNNNRISEFSEDGAFIKHLLTDQDDIYMPVSISYNKPYLWVAGWGKLKAFKLLHEYQTIHSEIFSFILSELKWLSNN